MHGKYNVKFLPELVDAPLILYSANSDMTSFDFQFAL
jgi:hypothetical protein